MSKFSTGTEMLRVDCGRGTYSERSVCRRGKDLILEEVGVVVSGGESRERWRSGRRRRRHEVAMGGCFSNTTHSLITTNTLKNRKFTMVTLDYLKLYNTSFETQFFMAKHGF